MRNESCCSTIVCCFSIISDRHCLPMRIKMLVLQDNRIGKKIEKFGVILMDTQIKLFENKKVRTLWDTESEEWYFSVVDVVAVLTDSPNPRKYWSVLKTRLKSEGSELATNCSQLKMPSSDGKMYKTDCMNITQIFRLIQSVPSPKAEPFKLWMAQVA